MGTAVSVPTPRLAPCCDGWSTLFFSKKSWIRRKKIPDQTFRRASISINGRVSSSVSPHPFGMRTSHLNTQSLGILFSLQSSTCALRTNECIASSQHCIMSYERPDRPGADFLGRDLTLAIHSSMDGGRSISRANSATIAESACFRWKCFHMCLRCFSGIPLSWVRLRKRSRGAKASLHTASGPPRAPGTASGFSSNHFLMWSVAASLITCWSVTSSPSIDNDERLKARFLGPIAYRMADPVWPRLTHSSIFETLLLISPRLRLRSAPCRRPLTVV